MFVQIVKTLKLIIFLYLYTAINRSSGALTSTFTIVFNQDENEACSNVQISRDVRGAETFTLTIQTDQGVVIGTIGSTEVSIIGGE